MKEFLTDEQIRVLRQTHRTLKDKKLADRIKAIMLLNKGLTYAQIAEILMLDEVTLRRYEKQYKANGIDGLLSCQYHGGKARLSIVQQEELATYLVAHTLTTAREIREYVQVTYGKTYTIIGITKFLHRLGFSYKKPKIVPGNVSLVLQQEFLKRYEDLKDGLGEKDQIYFSDATHPTHNTKPSYGWIKKGKKNDVYMKSNTGRKRLNIVGALNIQDKTAVVIEEETINAQTIIALFEAIKQKQKQGKVYVVLDNAKYHHARILNHWLLHHPRFKPIFLPPYSPNLNIIERLWRFFHQKVTNNHYFATFQEFQKATLHFFDNLQTYKKELETLLTENFQTLPQLQT
jgi:transposase